MLTKRDGSMWVIYYIEGGERHFFQDFDFLGKPRFVSEARIQEEGGGTVALFKGRETAREALLDSEHQLYPEVKELQLWDIFATPEEVSSGASRP